MRVFLLVLGVVLIMAFSSKAPTPLPTPSITPSPNFTKTIWPRAEWAATALKAVEASRLNGFNPRDGKAFCPNGMNLANWVNLLGAMVKHESGFDPNQDYRENFKDSDGTFVVSRGLFQISMNSSNNYGCGFKKASEVYDPAKNIQCSVRIFEKWVLQDGVIASSGSPWRGAARYWAVLRAKVTKTKATLKPYCT